MCLDQGSWRKVPGGSSFTKPGCADCCCNPTGGPRPCKGLRIPRPQLALVVGERIIRALKAVDKRLPIHEAQLLSCLKATGLHPGLLLNFQVQLRKDGITRLIR